MAFPENNVQEIGIVGVLALLKQIAFPKSLNNWKKAISFFVIDKNFRFMWIFQGGQWQIFEGEMYKPDLSISANEMDFLREFIDDQQNAALITSSIPPLGIGDSLKYGLLTGHIKNYLRQLSPGDIAKAEIERREITASVSEPENSSVDLRQIQNNIKDVKENQYQIIECPNCKSKSIVSSIYCFDPNDGKKIPPEPKKGGVLILIFGFLLLGLGLVMLVSLFSILLNGDTSGINVFFAIAITIFLLITGSKVISQGFKVFKQARRLQGLPVYFDYKCNNCQTSWNNEGTEASPK